MTYPSGMVVGVVYSGDVVASLTVNGSPFLSSVSYMPMTGVATQWSWANGNTYFRTIDTAGRITSMRLGTTVRQYSYDALNRVSGFTDNRANGTKRNSGFAYDEAGQLTGYSVNDTGSSVPTPSIGYAYDSNGNRSYMSVGKTQQAQSFSYQPGTNRIATGPWGAPYTYGSDGNPTSDGSNSFSYDAYGRMVGITSTDSNIQTRSFNGQGMRVRSQVKVWVDPYSYATSGGGTSAARAAQASTSTGTGSSGTQSAAAALRGTSTSATPAAAMVGGGGYWQQLQDLHYLHADDGSLLGEYGRPFNGTANSYSQETIWFQGMPVGTMINGVLYNISSDHLGTPRVINRASDNLEVWKWEGDPFGTEAPSGPGSWGQPLITYNLRFPGQQYDAMTGTHYNWMRDYEPWTGRYLQADPIGLAGGMSRYGYVGGNPVGDVDPMGLMGSGGGGSTNSSACMCRAPSTASPGPVVLSNGEILAWTGAAGALGGATGGALWGFGVGLTEAAELAHLGRTFTGIGALAEAAYSGGVLGTTVGAALAVPVGLLLIGGISLSRSLASQPATPSRRGNPALALPPIRVCQ